MLENLFSGFSLDLFVTFNVTDWLRTDLVLGGRVDNFGVLGAQFVGFFPIRGFVVLLLNWLILIFILIFNFPLIFWFFWLFFWVILILPPFVDFGFEFFLFFLPSVILPLFFDILLIGFRGSWLFNDSLTCSQVNEKILVGDGFSAFLAFFCS